MLTSKMHVTDPNFGYFSFFSFVVGITHQKVPE